MKIQLLDKDDNCLMGWNPYNKREEQETKKKVFYNHVGIIFIKLLFLFISDGNFIKTL